MSSIIQGVLSQNFITVPIEKRYEKLSGTKITNQTVIRLLNGNAWPQKTQEKFLQNSN